MTLRVNNIPYFRKNNPTAPTGIVLSIVEDLVLATLEELTNYEENKKKLEKSPSLNNGDGDNVVLSDDTFCRLGGEEEE